MLCIKCKKEIPEGSKFCNHCGAKQEKKARRRADGNLEKSIVVHGKRKTFYAKTEREMNQKIAAFMGEKQKEATRPFSYYADELERTWDTLSANSLKGYKPALRRCVKQYGDTPVADITPLSIKIYLEQLGKTMSQKTVNTHKSMLTQVMNLALLDGAVQINPAAVSYRATGKKKVQRDAAPEEFANILREHWDEDLFSFLGYFILNTGLRKGEALALTYKDIDLERKIITVSHSVYYISTAPYIKEPKTEAGKRIVAIPDCLAEKIKKGTGYVFSLNGKDPLKSYEVSTGWALFCSRHGFAEEKKDSSRKKIFVPAVTLHQLRHYYATKCYELGIDKNVVQSMMGHTDYGITENYTHIREQSLLLAKEKLNSAEK